MIGNNPERDLISLFETLKDATESQRVMNFHRSVYLDRMGVVLIVNFLLLY